ncbi:MAG: hypothetical protein ACTSVZ_09870 [Promethearchaeota archaeon]
MQVFIVKGNGEAHELKDQVPIKKLLDSNECYILSDDANRVVYLWIGQNAKVRSKFNGARTSQTVRSQVGLNYRSISLEEEDTNKDPEFLEAIENMPTDGFAKEVVEEGDDVKFNIEPSSSGPMKNAPSYAQLMNTKYNSSIEQTGPLYTGGGDSATSQSSPENYQSRENLDNIIHLLDEDEVPAEYEREMVIVGDKSYSVTEKKQPFLGKISVERILEPIESLPEGLFFAEGYVPRVLVKNQVVIAIEFLKKKG